MKSIIMKDPLKNCKHTSTELLNIHRICSSEEDICEPTGLHLQPYKTWPAWDPLTLHA